MPGHGQPTDSFIISTQLHFSDPMSRSVLVKLESGETPVLEETTIMFSVFRKPVML